MPGPAKLICGGDRDQLLLPSKCPGSLRPNCGHSADPSEAAPHGADHQRSGSAHGDGSQGCKDYFARPPNPAPAPGRRDPSSNPRNDRNAGSCGQHDAAAYRARYPRAGEEPSQVANRHFTTRSFANRGGRRGVVEAAARVCFRPLRTPDLYPMRIRGAGNRLAAAVAVAA